MGRTIGIRRLKGRVGDPEDVFADAWKRLRGTLRRYLGEHASCRALLVALEQEVYDNRKSGLTGGFKTQLRFATAFEKALHWIDLAFALERSDLDKLAATRGFKFVPPPIPLSQLLGAVETPIVELRGTL